MEFDFKGFRDRHVGPQEVPWDRILVAVPIVIVVLILLYLMWASVYTVEAHEKDAPHRIHGNVMNAYRGGGALIGNLPHDGCVEVAWMIDGNGLNPTAYGRLPPQMAALCAANMRGFDLGTTAGLNCSVAPGASPGNTRAARTSYYHLDVIKQKGRAYLPANNWLTNKLTDNVNINNTCNAYWNGSVNFYRDGGGCRNTGEIQAVITHEWGHGLDQTGCGLAGDQDKWVIESHLRHNSDRGNLDAGRVGVLGQDSFLIEPCQGGQGQVGGVNDFFLV